MQTLDHWETRLRVFSPSIQIYRMLKQVPKQFFTHHYSSRQTPLKGNSTLFSHYFSEGLDAGAKPILPTEEPFSGNYRCRISSFKVQRFKHQPSKRCCDSADQDSCPLLVLPSKAHGCSSASAVSKLIMQTRLKIKMHPIQWWTPCKPAELMTTKRTTNSTILLFTSFPSALLNPHQQKDERKQPEVVPRRFRLDIRII